MALFSLNFVALNLQTLHEKHSMTFWLLSVHRVDKSIIFVENWHPGWTYSSDFPVVLDYLRINFPAATLTCGHLNRFCLDRTALTVPQKFTKMH
jgi:hypothetical protein